MSKILPPDLVAAPGAPTLLTVTFTETPRLPGVRAGEMSSIELDKPHEALKHWRLAVRGASVFLISPRGWRQGKKRHEWDDNGANIVHEIPRALCVFQWSGSPDLIDIVAKGKYDSPPFGGPLPDREKLAPPPEPEIDPKDLGDA